MFLTPKKHANADAEVHDVTEGLLREQNRWFCSSARTLLYLLKASALDISDIDVDAFRKRIDKLVRRAEEGEAPREWNRALEADNPFLLSHIDRQKEYLQTAESELRDVIEFMHKSLLGVIGEGDVFTGKMHESSLRMQQIAGLEDIRRIKDELRAEIQQMRQAIRDKEAQDAKRMEALSREIGSLRSDLEEAKLASMTDQLTGASSRLCFDLGIERYLERYVLSGSRFSLLLCDLDDFKRINDLYGHREGDCVLKAFVLECQALIRPKDLIARYGGEEFAIVLPGVSLRAALRKAQKICSRVSSNRYLVENKQISGVLAFTVSIGVAEVRRDDTLESLMDRVDRSLYMAKRTGKNRAVSERSLCNEDSGLKAA